MAAYRVIASAILLLILTTLTNADVLKRDFLANDLFRTFQQSKTVLSVSSFSWSDCGQSSDPGHVTTLTLTPDPLKLPGNLTLGFSAKLSSTLQAPIVLDVEMQKKILFWITVPCLHDLGSCNYPDICQLLPLLNCPQIFQKYGIPCQCPIPANMYHLPASDFYVDDGFLPSFLTDGFYKVTGKMSQNKQEIGCLHLEFSITR